MDDVANFKVNDARGHGDCGFALKMKVLWSKSVMEEQQCPPQIPCGAMDPVFVSFLIWQFSLKAGLCQHEHRLCSLVHRADRGEQRQESHCCSDCWSQLEAVVQKHPQFKALLEEDGDEEGTGTPPLRKFPSNCVRGGAAAPDETERGEDGSLC